jgi:hypothetical protein
MGCAYAIAFREGLVFVRHGQFNDVWRGSIVRAMQASVAIANDVSHRTSELR